MCFEWCTIHSIFMAKIFRWSNLIESLDTNTVSHSVKRCSCSLKSVVHCTAIAYVIYNAVDSYDRQSMQCIIHFISMTDIVRWCNLIDILDTFSVGHSVKRSSCSLKSIVHRAAVTYVVRNTVVIDFLTTIGTSDADSCNRQSMQCIIHFVSMTDIV